MSDPYADSGGDWLMGSDDSVPAYLPAGSTVPKDTAPSTGSGFLASFGGFLSKAAETAIDVWGANEKAKAAGSVYPTGQTNPEQLSALNVANQQQQSAQLKQYLLIGGGVLAAVVLVLVVARRSK